jgi:hypothetical protein
MLLSLSLSAAAAVKSLSFTERLVLWLHIAFVIFTVGPVTAAIMSTPRYIRARNLVVVRYLYRTTRIFVLISLGVLVFGIVLAQQLKDFAKPWLVISMTLFVVAIVLLVIVLRDQRKSITALETAEAADAWRRPPRPAHRRPGSRPRRRTRAPRPSTTPPRPASPSRRSPWRLPRLARWPPSSAAGSPPWAPSSPSTGWSS